MTDATYRATYREYVEAIYELEEEGIELIQARIADWLGVSRASVSEMVHKMAEDGLDIIDVEHAVLHGEITRIERDDPRGTKYVIEGIAADEPLVVGVVGRFLATGRYLIITVYAITDGHEDL